MALNGVGLYGNTLQKITRGGQCMSVHYVTVVEAEKRFAELFELATKGEEILIDDGHGKTVKIIVQDARPEQLFGKYAGKIKVRADFDEELDESFWLGEEKE
jgi:antitoxin (DNA-binding transcriptional repressor) of toxin-antitoxin stability system